MKILVSCYACSPYRGSEPGMGWNFVSSLAKHHELHVIVEKGEFEDDIERYFAENPEKRKCIKFYFIKREHHNTLRKIWPPSYYWFYRKWQKKAFILAKKLDAKEHFDVVHQLNMAGYREPGYLWQMNKPFVWGPLGGFENVPWCMIPSMGLKGMLFYSCYNIINTWQMHVNGRVKMAIKKADAIISATAKIQEQIRKLYGKDSIIIPEVGFEGSADNAYALREEGEKLSICWSGLHIPRKALNLLLEALALVRREDIELHVIGKGEKTNEWMKMAERLDLKNVTWHGWIERSEALRIMQCCHLFCITSLNDLTSTVILEALSYGMPVIALDHCGFSNVITDNCGRKIPIKNKSQVVRDFASAINEMADNEELRRRLSEGARKRAMEYNWEDKANIICGIYSQVKG